MSDLCWRGSLYTGDDVRVIFERITFSSVYFRLPLYTLDYKNYFKMIDSIHTVFIGKTNT